MNCSVSRVAWAAAQCQYEIQKLWSTFLLARFKAMLSGDAEDWNPNTAEWLEKYHINLDADILVAKDNGKETP